MRSLSYFFLMIVISMSGRVSLSAAAVKPTSEEFIAPLQHSGAAPFTVPLRKTTGRVRKLKDDKIGMPIWRANTAQEAITAAINQRLAGCQMIRFGRDDFGWIATGTRNYAATDNPVAARRARRSARFKAFTDARAQLISCLRGLPLEIRQQMSNRLEQDDAIRLALINLAANDEERREQALRILARGFVAYVVDDDLPTHTIRVHLAVTPKTATQLTRPAANAIEAISLAEGLKQTVAEVEGGLIPPMGNRLIVVNATGELALVGYAINLIGVHPNPSAQSKLRADAEKIATRHAIEALTGLATNDDAAWQNGLDEESRDEVRTATDGYDDSEPSVRRFGQIRDLNLSFIKDDSGLQTLREGGLPSAVTIKRSGGDEAIAIVIVYTPPVKKREVTPPAQQSTTSATLPIHPITDGVNPPAPPQEGSPPHTPTPAAKNH